MAKQPTKASVRSTLNKAVVSTLKKAFGQGSRYHIKDSGPSWVNSPKGPQRSSDDVFVDKGITVSVKRGRKKGRKEVGGR